MPRAQSRKPNAALVALLGVVVLVYLPSLGHGWVMWDDPVHVLYNPVVRDWWSAGWLARIATPALGYPAGVPVAIYALVVEWVPGRAAGVLHGGGVGGSPAEYRAGVGVGEARVRRCLEEMAGERRPLER